MGKPAARKRRPGGGRKPSPTAGAGAALSIRIRPETRGALEAEAAKSGKKISRVAEKLLLDGIEYRRDRSFVSRPVRALAVLIETLEHGSRGYAADSRVCEWSSDPTVFEVFRLAIGKLLEKLRPPGDIDSSVDGPLVGQSPEERAEAIFRNVWVDLLSARPPVTPKEMAEYYDHYGPPSQDVVATYGEVSRRSYIAAEVREALNIKGRQESEK